MIFSFAALLSTLLLSSTIAFLQILFVKKLRINRLLSGSFLMIISIIFIVRLFLPVEFFYKNVTIQCNSPLFRFSFV